MAATKPAVLPIAAFYYWRDFGASPRVAYWLPLCAYVATVVALLPPLLVLCWPQNRRLRAAREGEKPPAPRRALSDTHGSAEWMNMDEARQLFPDPHPVYGGVVVGEAYASIATQRRRCALIRPTPRHGARAAAGPC